MNIDNLRKIQEWLRAGTPHAVFDMSLGLLNSRASVAEYLSENPNQPYAGRPDDCGSVCCIAGYAAQLAEPLKFGPGQVDDGEYEAPWQRVSEVALGFLDLDRDYDYGSVYHPLFSAPFNDCTPNEAANAIDNLIAGNDNIWRGVR